MTDAGNTLNRIIVPLDGGPVAEQAIPVASVLAAQAGLPVTLVTVLSDHDPKENAAFYLEARSAEVRGLGVHCEVLHGMPAGDPLVDYVQGHPGSIVCCSTHARVDARKFMLGSVAEELVRRSPAPVMLVGPRAALPEPDGRYDEIVICAEDESARSRCSLRPTTCRRHWSSTRRCCRWSSRPTVPVGDTALMSPPCLRS